MVRVALFLRLEAKPGKEAELEAFLRNGLSLVDGEAATVAWLAIRLDRGTFALLGGFPHDAGREAHLGGRMVEVLMAKASVLLSRTPIIERADVLAAKLP